MSRYIRKRGSAWVVLNRHGKVLSRHRTEKLARQSFAAMMMSMHGGRFTRRRPRARGR